MAIPVCAAAYALLAYPFLSTDSLIGDIGDARFNLYVLEHAFRCLNGLDSSYRSPAIFYPFPGTLLFSDTHLGSVPFYILFRAFGAQPGAAFSLWIFTGYLLTFLASYYALLRFRFAPLPALVAAILFSFSLPSLAQVGHAQLIYRIGVPLAFLSLWNFMRAGHLRDAALLVIWLAFQLLCSIYLGLFLLLSLIIFGACWTALNWKTRPLSRSDWDGLHFARSQHPLRRWSLIVITAIISAALATLLYEYHYWSRLYGFGRTWDVASSMIPTWRSYLRMDPLPYWELFYEKMIGGNTPIPGEQNLFVGIGALSLMVIGAVSIVARDVAPDTRRFAKVSLSTVLILLLLFTRFGGFTFYYYVNDLPGFSAIRAVARIGIVLVFPATLLAATAVQIIVTARPRLPCLALLVFPLVIASAEILTMKIPSFKIGDADIRAEVLVNEALAKSSGIANPILFVNEDSELGYKLQLDAMFAAKQLGWPTINGYSGNQVPGYDYKPDCGSPARQFSAFENWRQAHRLGPEISAQDFSNRVVMVGWPTCGSGRKDDADGLGPPPPHDLARFISLVPVSLKQQPSQVVFEIAVRNSGDEKVVVHSFAPIRVSWRFVEVGASIEKGMGWNTRVQLAHDIVPRGSTNVVLTGELPKKPGEYRLQVSLVSEHAYWFHDEGMAILGFEQPISIR